MYKPRIAVLPTIMGHYKNYPGIYLGALLRIVEQEWT